jgi:DNA end-binding protein Ku
MAEKLIGMMTSEFEPDKYKDNYREAIMEVIEKKSKGQALKVKAKRKEITTNVVDIMSKLKASLESTGKRKTTAAKSTAARRKKARAA